MSSFLQQSDAVLKHDVSAQLLPRIHDWTTFSLAFALIGLCYGRGFGTMPSFTADFFGAKAMGGIYGIILLAWGLAAIPSPIMIARVHQSMGKYAPAIHVITIVMLGSLILPLIARKPGNEQGRVAPEPLPAHR